MTMNRDLYKGSFMIDKIPPWNCPSCSKGVLRGKDKSIKTLESASSLKFHNDEDFEATRITGSFLGILYCDNPNCQDRIIISGDMQVHEHYIYDNHPQQIEEVCSEFLIPTHFNPQIHIFEIVKEVPMGIKNEVLNAFNLFWLDKSSCANKIRVIVELILDHQKIKKSHIINHKKITYILHKRIELFKNINSELGELFLAIKWIGNSGSHANEYLKTDDILDGFEILQESIFKLYNTDSDRIKKLSKQINQRRKPIGIGRKRIFSP